MDQSTTTNETPGASKDVSSHPVITSVTTREEKLSLQKDVQGIIGLLRIKFIALYNMNPAAFPDSRTTMFDSQDGENYVFRVGAYFKFSFPAKFIRETKNITNKDLDFLIQNWSFLINGKEISLSAWTESTVIDTLIKDSTAKVVHSISTAGKTPDEIDEINRNNIKEVEGLQGKLNRLVKKLLPTESILENMDTQELPKLSKHSLFHIVPRV